MKREIKQKRGGTTRNSTVAVVDFTVQCHAFSFVLSHQRVAELKHVDAKNFFPIPIPSHSLFFLNLSINNDKVLSDIFCCSGTQLFYSLNLLCPNQCNRTSANGSSTKKGI